MNAWLGSPIDDYELLARLPEFMVQALVRQNGYIAFGGGFHLRGACLNPGWHSLRSAWEGPSAIHRLFPSVLESDVPFAEDCFGDQFLLRNGLVLRLSAEGGELESTNMTWPEFMAKVYADPVSYLLLQPLIRFQDAGGVLKPGQLLSVYPPFITRESKNGVSIRPVAAQDRMSFLADFARQIRGE